MAETQSADVMEGKEPLVRVTFCFKKKQGISDEELLERWENFGRRPLLSSLFQAKSIKYNQFRLSPERKEEFSLIPKEGWLNCDGVTDLLAKDVESVMSLFHDPTYIHDMKPEHNIFMDWQGIIIMIGYNRVKYKKPLPKDTGWTVGEGKKPLVKFALFFKKNPDVTSEQADKYWDEEHAPLVLTLPIVKEKLVKYNQFHFSSIGKEQFKTQNAEQWSDFLGVAEFWAKDVQSIVDILTHEDYINVLIQFEAKFMDRGSLKALIGYDATP